MIRFQRITHPQNKEYQFMEQLMITAFPPEEYRDLQELKQVTEHEPKFHTNLILHYEEAIGLMNYWDFEDFYYIEHFAISPQHRNGGLGKEVLQKLCQQLSRPIVLEVEPPTKEMPQRRINFYRRQGFELWDTPYLQPPYKAGDDFLPLMLMVYGELHPNKDFNHIKSVIHKEVYHVS